MSDQQDKAKKPKVDKTDKSASTLANLEKVAGELAKALEASKAPQYGDKTPNMLFGHIKGETGKDSRPYSFMNIIKAIKEQNWEYAKLERQIHFDMLKEGYEHSGGMLVPSNPDAVEASSPRLKGIKSLMKLGDGACQPDMYQKAYKEYKEKALSAFGTDPLGGALVMPVLANSIIELLRANVVTVKAGATELSLPPSGSLSWARQTADPTYYWVGENTAPTATDPTLANIIFTPKKAAALVIISNEALMYTNPAIEVVVRQSLAERGARFEDLAFLEGTGGSSQPLGIINTSGIQSHTATTVGTDGNTFQPEDVATMLAKVQEANDPGATAWIMRPLKWAAIRNRRAGSGYASGDGAGLFMFQTSRGDYEKGDSGRLMETPVLTTTSISNARTKGSGTALGYILTGNFQRVVIARAGTMEIAALSSGTEFKNDQTAVRAIMRLDMQLTHTKPFVLCDQLVIA